MRLKAILVLFSRLSICNAKKQAKVVHAYVSDSQKDKDIELVLNFYHSSAEDDIKDITVCLYKKDEADLSRVAAAEERQILLATLKEKTLTCKIPRADLEDNGVYAFLLSNSLGNVAYPVLWRYTNNALKVAYSEREDYKMLTHVIRGVGLYAAVFFAACLLMHHLKEARRRIKDRGNNLDAMIRSIQASFSETGQSEQPENSEQPE